MLCILVFRPLAATADVKVVRRLRVPTSPARPGVRDSANMGDHPSPVAGGGPGSFPVAGVAKAPMASGGPDTGASQQLALPASCARVPESQPLADVTRWARATGGQPSKYAVVPEEPEALVPGEYQIAEEMQNHPVCLCSSAVNRVIMTNQRVIVARTYSLLCGCLGKTVTQGMFLYRCASSRSTAAHPQSR